MCTVETASVAAQQWCKARPAFARRHSRASRLTNAVPARRTAYVMCKTGLGHDDAFNFVQGRRFCIAPRTEFQHQIEVRSCCLEPIGWPAPRTRLCRAQPDPIPLIVFALIFDTSCHCFAGVRSDLHGQSNDGNRPQRVAGPACPPPGPRGRGRRRRRDADRRTGRV